MTDVERTPTHLNSLPSDFSDVQPKSYDPEFISQISSKMQVPDRIEAYNGDYETRQYNNNMSHFTAEMAAVKMQVPESISLHENTPVRGRLEKLEFNPREINYVGLLTPPRTLTMEEAFANQAVDEEEEQTKNRHTYSNLPNGDTHAMAPYTPGASLSDSILHNDEDDATQLRTQVAKLSRRMATMEAENQRRATRELVLYPLVFGYMFFKMFSWLFRPKY